MTRRFQLDLRMRIQARARGDTPPSQFERYVPHEPTPKQREFISLNCREAFYGGAAVLNSGYLKYIAVPLGFALEGLALTDAGVLAAIRGEAVFERLVGAVIGERTRDGDIVLAVIDGH